MKENWIEQQLIEIANKNLVRSAFVYPAVGAILEINNNRILNFSSNDYLNLSKHPKIIESSIKALEKYGTGSTASRLVSGSLTIHDELEKKLAAHKNYPSALLFGSGYMTSTGVIPAIAKSSDIIFSDKLVHSCILDGIKLSGAKHIRFKHNDTSALSTRLDQFADSEKRKIIIVESLYSMDGDLAPLLEIAQLAKKYNAFLMVDEAHATGTFGPNGSGRVCELNLEDQVDISMGTISKGMAGYGGFIACSENLKKLLVQHASTFIYTTAPPPSIIGAALGALEILDEQPYLGKSLQKKASFFRNQLKEANIETISSDSHIIPILIGDNQATLKIANQLKEANIIVGAIRPPTVPEGTARLRISISLAHSNDDLVYTVNQIKKLMKI